MANYTVLDCLRALQISHPHSWLRVEGDYLWCVDPYTRKNAQTENMWGYESLLQSFSIYGGDLLSSAARVEFVGTVYAVRGIAQEVATIRLLADNALVVTVLLAETGTEMVP